ncbi:MAG: thioredoxin fold domain-containing protein [Planctomycetes bacterium]|jgi:thioredoxin 1|nr:thioredoxin fold domain-containing protein [Planctomycetota bacterium]
MAKVMVTDINAETFAEEVLESPVPVVVEFFTPMCQFCRRFEATFDSLADEYEEAVRFRRVNAAQERELAVQYNVFGVPTTIIFEGGEPIERFSGLVPETQIAKAIDNLLH